MDIFDRRIKQRFDEYHDGIGYRPPVEPESFGSVMGKIIMVCLTFAIMGALALCWYAVFFGVRHHG